MKKYSIRYNPEAITDLEDSFEWGLQAWGLDAARKWYIGMNELLMRRLSSMPESCPIAPENNYFDFEVRQLNYGRYRILFTIKDNSVRVLYIRGPFSGV